jgi:hypothetical protein
MAYIDQKRIPVLDSINIDVYMDEMLSGNALKHIGAETGENERKAITNLYKAGKIDAVFFSRTSHGSRKFHDIFREWFHRGTYYFAKERREEALHEIAYAIRPFNSSWDRKSATSCLIHTGLTRNEIRKVEDLVGCNIAPLIREEGK